MLSSLNDPTVSLPICLLLLNLPSSFPLCYSPLSSLFNLTFPEAALIPQIKSLQCDFSALRTPPGPRLCSAPYSFPNSLHHFFEKLDAKLGWLLRRLHFCYWRLQVNNWADIDPSVISWMIFSISIYSGMIVHRTLFHYRYCVNSLIFTFPFVLYH